MASSWPALRVGSRAPLNRWERLALFSTVAILVVVLAPTGRDLLEHSRTAEARAEMEAIAAAIGASQQNREEQARVVLGASPHPAERSPEWPLAPRAPAWEATAGAASWGVLPNSPATVQLPSRGSHPAGVGESRASRPASDPPGTGGNLDCFQRRDPWGNAYFVSVRALGRGETSSSAPRKILVLSAGPDGRWQTLFSEGEVREVLGDDIACVLYAP